MADDGCSSVFGWCHHLRRYNVKHGPAARELIDVLHHRTLTWLGWAHRPWGNADYITSHLDGVNQHRTHPV
jgi:hypothetical protein